MQLQSAGSNLEAAAVVRARERQYMIMLSYGTAVTMAWKRQWWQSRRQSGRASSYGNTGPSRAPGDLGSERGHHAFR